ncbi:hypothetical protein chiPu_0028518, partial [Chiloscyllium punctatum]|nr:hypothetical protein [Chiloscyllium punctatum]
LIMAPKKVKSGRDSGVNKPQRITMETKKEIIAKDESGARVSDLAKLYDMAKRINWNYINSNGKR